MKNKVVIITGASGGIGKSLAVKFANSGSKVVIASRDMIRLQELKNSTAGNIFPVQCDVSKESDCRNLIESTVNNYGAIDVLINNAGISMRALFQDVELDVLRKLMDINFWGTVYCTKFALPYLFKSHGSITGVSSIAGKKGLPARTGYSASKFAMEGFLETLRIENLKNDLHVLVACPGFTSTNIRKTALSATGDQQGESPRAEDKMMSPELVAELIYDAIKNRRRDLVLTSQGKLTVLLNKFFPAFMDKMVFNHMAKEPDSPLKKSGS